MTRLRLTVRAIRDGSYDYTAVVGLLVAVAGLIVDAAGQAETLPPALVPYILPLVPYARLVALLGGFLAANGKSVLVRDA